MSNYVRSIPFKTMFDGDEVTARIKPILRGDLLTLKPTFSDGEELTNHAVAHGVAPLLPKYVVDLAGLNDAAGAPIGLDVVCAEAFFSELVLELGSALLSTAKIPNAKAPASP